MQTIGADKLFRLISVNIRARRTTTTGHQIVLGRIHGYTIQPGVKLAIATKTGQRPPCLDKGLLSDILHLILIAHITADQGKNSMLVLTHQQIKSALITFTGAFDQFFIGHPGLPLLTPYRGETLKIATGSPANNEF